MLLFFTASVTASVRFFLEVRDFESRLKYGRLLQGDYYAL